MSIRVDSYKLHRVITPATSLALISVARAKDVLGIPADDTSQDGMIGRQIDAVSAAINAYCERVFVKQVYRDQIRSVCNWLGFGHPLFTLQKPICTDAEGLPLLTVTESGALYSDIEVQLDTGALYRLDASGQSGWSDSLIQIDYTAGYEIIPPDVQAAATEWVAARWSARGRDPTLRSYTIPDVITEAYFSGADQSVTSIPAGARDLLAPYRTVVFA